MNKDGNKGKLSNSNTVKQVTPSSGLTVTYWYTSLLNYFNTFSSLTYATPYKNQTFIWS